MATNGRFGGEKTGGRQAGTLNKLSTNVKDAVWQTFVDLQKDPNANLTAWAIKNPKDFYLIAAKLIPTEIAVKAEVTQIEIEKTIITNANFIELPPAPEPTNES